jgi:hypothetical protein
MESLPTIRDHGHDRCLCTFTVLQQLEIPSARSWVAHVRKTGMVRQGRRYGAHPSQYKSHLPGNILPDKQSRAPFMGKPSRVWD